jgi:hypothetical protein
MTRSAVGCGYEKDRHKLFALQIGYSDNTKDEGGQSISRFFV